VEQLTESPALLEDEKKRQGIGIAETTQKGQIDAHYRPLHNMAINWASNKSIAGLERA
jgi:hypothetical protein